MTGLSVRVVLPTDEDMMKAHIADVTKSVFCHIDNFGLISKSSTLKHDNITHVLLKRHWLPMEYRIRFTIIVFAFKAMNGHVPHNLTELLIPLV